MDNPNIKSINNWWLLAIKGFLTLSFGLIALTYKDINQIKTIKFFSGLICIIGVLLIFGTIYSSKHKIRWRWYLIEGIVNLLIGGAIIFIINYQRLAAIAMFTEIIALWALIYGLIQIFAAFQYTRFSVGWISLILSGLIALTYTTLAFMTIFPGTSAKTAAIGLFTALIGGVILVNSIGFFRQKKSV